MEEQEVARVISGEELRKLKEIRLARGQKALLFIKELPRPKLLSEGKYKIPKGALELVIVETGLKHHPYGIPKGTVYDDLGFSGRLSILIGDRQEELENFVEAVVKGRGVRTLGELVIWLRDEFLVPAFKKVLIADRKLDEEGFLRADHDEIIEDVLTEVNGYIVGYGLRLHSLSIIYTTRGV